MSEKLKAYKRNVSRVAYVFCLILQDWLGKEGVRLTCQVSDLGMNDVCDANQAMLDALEIIDNEFEFDVADAEQIQFINDIWELADNNRYVPEKVWTRKDDTE